jgi:hypothetical protein
MEAIAIQELIECLQSPTAHAEVILWIERSLTEWVRWADLKLLAGTDGQGLYLIAEGQPPRQGELAHRNIVCIGEAHSQQLVDRLCQFNNSAFGHSETHGPGLRHRQRGAPPQTSVYVCVLSLKLAEPWKSVVPPYLEGVLLWNYKKSNGDLPLDNQHPRNRTAFGKTSKR